MSEYILKIKKKYWQFLIILKSSHWVYQKINNKKINKLNFKKGLFAVDIVSNMGLGANLHFALQIMFYCHENNLEPKLKFTRPNQKNTDNPFDYLFEQNSTENHPNIEFARIRNWSDLNIGIDWNFDQKLNFDISKILIQKHLKIKSRIHSIVDNFVEKNFKNRNVLGIHYRATDKKSEAILASYDYIERNIQYYLNLFPDTNSLFISTDDKGFISFIKGTFSHLEIITPNDTYVSKKNTSIHLSTQDINQMNQEALINILILSRCSALMKTASFMSAWSKLFKLDLPVILLTKSKEQYFFFPEREIAKDVLFEPVRNKKEIALEYTA
tara:strand:- start:30622 stop:31605 length:984 start_codon:yes stop_codon:yes gene_type:complete